MRQKHESHWIFTSGVMNNNNNKKKLSDQYKCKALMDFQYVKYMSNKYTIVKTVKNLIIQWNIKSINKQSTIELLLYNPTIDQKYQSFNDQTLQSCL